MKKKKVLIISLAIITFTLIIAKYIFKDSYSYYIDTNNLSFVSSKIGKFGSIEKSDIKKDAGSQLQDTAVFGLYRYYGTKDTVKNNYICFGTNNKSTCLGTPDTYMYRIIGITDNSSVNSDLGIPENSLKIIKASKYGGSVVWNGSNGSNGATWDTASVNTNTLNTTFYNTISTTESGVNWKNIILSNHNWYIGDKTSAGNSEATAKSSTNKPIGLMYQSDYYNAGNQNTNNWLFIKNGWITNAAEYEWTMSSRDSHGAWGVDNDYGSFSHYYMTITGAIRPVFYLLPEISLSGTGADSNPYLIS